MRAADKFTEVARRLAAAGISPDDPFSPADLAPPTRIIKFPNGDMFEMIERGLRSAPAGRPSDA